MRKKLKRKFISQVASLDSTLKITTPSSPLLDDQQLSNISCAFCLEEDHQTEDCFFKRKIERLCTSEQEFNQACDLFTSLLLLPLNAKAVKHVLRGDKIDQLA